jgi:8-oxo-dGTP diphosphatase
MSEKGITGAGVGVMVINENKVLLGLRNSDPAKADSALHGEGNWTMPGGKMHFGDTFEQAAARELIEETGIVGNNFKVFSLSNDKVPDAHFITIGLLCSDFSGEPKVMEPDEIVEWRWWEIDKLPSNIFPPSKIMAANYLSGKMYN